MSALDLKGARVCVTGGAGFLGRSVCRALHDRGVPEEDIFIPRKKDFDLTREEDVERMYEKASPDVVFHLAAEVGGIGANMQHPGRFFYANMAMGLHLVERARTSRVEKFVYVGTVCSYPKNCPVPFREESMWEGYPEETNAPYGVAKKSVAVMLGAYRREYGLRSAYVVPVNLYGPGDNFDPSSSHVIPALIRRFEEARSAGLPKVECWGTGRATREFLHVDDAAEGVVRAAEIVDDPAPINLGGGREMSVQELASVVANMCGYRGSIEWNTDRPDGQPRRLLDSSRAESAMDWGPRKDFHEGLAETIEWWRSRAGRP